MPTYSCTEMCEMIAEAESMPHLLLLNVQWHSECYQYTLEEIKKIELVEALVIKIWSEDKDRFLKQILQA